MCLFLFFLSEKLIYSYILSPITPWLKEPLSITCLAGYQSNPILSDNNYKFYKNESTYNLMFGVQIPIIDQDEQFFNVFSKLILYSSIDNNIYCKFLSIDGTVLVNKLSDYKGDPVTVTYGIAGAINNKNLFNKDNINFNIYNFGQRAEITPVLYVGKAFFSDETLQDTIRTWALLEFTISIDDFIAGFKLSYILEYCFFDYTSIGIGIKNIYNINNKEYAYILSLYAKVFHFYEDGLFLEYSFLLPKNISIENIKKDFTHRIFSINGAFYFSI